MTFQKAAILSAVAGAILLPGGPDLAAADTNNVADEVRLLREENALLKAEVQKQGSALDTLTKKVQDLEAADRDRAVSEGENTPPASPGGLSLGNVHLGAEGGVAFFNTGPGGFAPHSNFRVDETRVFVDAPIWDSVYFASDLDLATRENPDLNAKLGELYLDFEDVSQLWGKDSQLNVRAGRMQVPFGEEYQYRYAMENPLITHSLSDIWGIDPGVELYGALGKFSYAVAAQNGGANGVQDFDGDKSVAGRISYDPNAHWHFSLSGMRTGDISAQNDHMSALWFGNGFFRSIGSPATSTFHAELVEGDIAARWKSGQVKAFGGFAHYADNDPARDNDRNLFYYAVEARQNLTRKIYLAGRFSQILTDKGYPLVGLGNFGEYFFATSTKQLWRASFGAGYQFSSDLAVKAEYAIEHGTETGGGPRYDENFIGTEAVFKF